MANRRLKTLFVISAAFEFVEVGDGATICKIAEQHTEGALILPHAHSIWDCDWFALDCSKRMRQMTPGVFAANQSYRGNWMLDL